MTTLLIILGIVILVRLLYVGRPTSAWLGAGAAWLAAWLAASGITAGFIIVAGIVALVAVVLGVPMVRRRLISSRLLDVVQPMMPRMGETERIALEAGTVWWDAELFSGRPDWNKLLDFELQPLSEKEQAFLDGPVTELCRRLDDWAVLQDRGLPDDIWAFLKREGFFGMIIPEAHGGLGFSAIAHSAVVTKIASRSIAAATVVMVPNSLGPAELLLHYGTDEQKAHYLPRLARGEDMPCFALTEPEAGSDAAASKSTGIVCKGQFEGAEVLGIRLNWSKRYITLAPVATVVGLAFRMYDPDGLLGGEADLGITCALIPHHLPGIDIGHRHDPMGVPFPNGPIVGRDVFVPIDYVIGGLDGIGHGWRMLMESLAAGRSISLPSLSVAGAQVAARSVGAYGTIREQFDMPIGRFEGIEEPLARIAGMTYLMDATRRLTCGAVDAGEKPAILSAIAKAYLTDGMRAVINDAMDIQAGAAVCRGARNVLSRVYAGIPIAITVEGANILTRSLIVYGQGAIRCHPHVHDAMTAVADRDVARFDRAVFGFLGLMSVNKVRALLLALTHGRLARAPVAGPMAPHIRALTRLSAAFAFLSDMTMVLMGGGLKRHQKVGGRLADALAWMYLASACLKRFHDDGQPPAHCDLLRWCCALSVWKVETALAGILDNMPARPLAWSLRLILFPFGRRQRRPDDRLGGLVANKLLEDDPVRRDLTADIFVSDDKTDALGRLEWALDQVVRARPARDKIRVAMRNGAMGAAGDAEAAVERGILTEAEGALLQAARDARLDAIQVDAFDPQTYHGLRG